MLNFIRDNKISKLKLTETHKTIKLLKIKVKKYISTKICSRLNLQSDKKGDKSFKARLCTFQKKFEGRDQHQIFQQF